ncbi:MAG: ComEC/Rec2 family competence protein [Clostridium sp.]
MIFKIKKRSKKYLVFLFMFICIFKLSSYYINMISKEKINPNYMYIHYINVDQGDAILVQVNNKNLLIDSGPKTHKKQLMKYLLSLGISNLDYVIATHPHDDHIGNMNTIIDTFNINYFFAPKVYTSTKSFENMIESLKNKNMKIIPIKRGCDTISLGSRTHVNIFSPINDIYDNENNYSPVIKISYGSTSFLFTGDAEEEIESALISLNDDISADVLKIAHHGSATSTSDSFLYKVNPKYAVISVGKDNVYGHPDKNVLSKLCKHNIKTLRTDINNSITIISDGYSLKFC